MTKQKKLFMAVVSGLFPAQLSETLYPTDGDSNTVYYQAMDLVREPNRDYPELGKEYFEHDGILSMFPQRGRERGYRNVHVSFEIKSRQEDLWRDSKMSQYFGATDLFFLVVPRNLIPAAIKKIRSFGERIPYVGLVDSTSGEIVIMPAMQDALKDRERENRVLAKIYKTKRRIDRPEACYQIRSVELGTHQRPEFVSLAGMNVNRGYFKIVSSALLEEPF